MGQGELLWPWKRNGSDSLGEMTKLICPEPARWGLWFRPPANCIRPDSLRGTGARCVSWGPSQNSALLGPRENQPLNFTVLFTQALRGVGSSGKPYFSLYSDCFLPKVSPTMQPCRTNQTRGQPCPTGVDFPRSASPDRSTYYNSE